MVVALGIIIPQGTAQAAQYHTRSYYKAPSNYGGTRAEITWEPIANLIGCVIFSTSSLDNAGSVRQLQAGVIRCNNSPLADCSQSSLTAGRKFTEAIATGASTNCELHGFANAGVSYTFKVSKVDGTSTYRATISGAAVQELSGFGTAKGWSWGEQFDYADSACGGDSWRAEGYIREWEVRQGDNWILGDTILATGDDRECWDVIGTPSSGNYGLKYR